MARWFGRSTFPSRWNPNRWRSTPTCSSARRMACINSRNTTDGSERDGTGPHPVGSPAPRPWLSHSSFSEAPIIPSTPGTPQNGDAWWTFRAEDTVEVSPVVSDGLVFISSGLGWLYALDAQNGAVIWQTQLDSEASATVAIHDGRLFVGDDIGVFYILSARTGQEWFRYRTLKTIAGAPVISADGLRAYFPSSGQLYAVSANQREAPGLFQFKKIWAQLWLWQVPGVPRPPGQQGGLWRFSPENPLQGIYSSPALADAEDGGVIYVGGYDHFMYALDALTGEPLWTFLAQDGIYASPLIVKDQLIFGDNSGNLYSLNRHDGSVDWTLKLSSGLKIAPALSNETLIVRTDNGDIYGIR